MEAIETTGAVERSVFAVAERLFRWADVVCAAKTWGDWDGCVKEAREGRAALARAQRTSLPLAGPEFDAEEERFRRARRLLAADELATWLSRRDVDVAGWRDYIRTVVLRRRWGHAPPDEAWSQGDLGDAAWVHAICSGTLDATAHRLAARVAVASALGRLDALAGPTTEPEVACLDEIYSEFCDRAATGAAIEREVERHRLDWVRIECRAQAAANHDVVREAALCIRDDGLEFEQVAAAAGLTVEHRSTDLEGLDPELRPHLLGARVGEVLGPLTIGSEYWLVEVLDKRIPSGDDPEVWARAHDAVVARAVEAEVVDRVRWDERV